MIALLRLMLVAAVVLTVLFFLIRIYARSLRRERLEEQWDEGRRREDWPEDREGYIAAGMEAYERSLGPRLIWGVYVIPLTAIAAIFWYVNFA